MIENDHDLAPLQHIILCRPCTLGGISCLRFSYLGIMILDSNIFDLFLCSNIETC